MGQAWMVWHSRTVTPEKEQSDALDELAEVYDDIPLEDRILPMEVEESSEGTSPNGGTPGGGYESSEDEIWSS